MFSRQEIKSNLMGCFETFLFMRKGIERFEVSPGAAIKSFIIPVILLPVLVPILIMMSPAGTFSFLFVMHTLRIVLAAGLYLLAVYFLARQYHREGHFNRFLVVFNWINITSLVFLLPIVVGVAMGTPLQSFTNYAIFITLTNYVYLAFVLTHCFKLPWEMGGFIAIIGLAIDDNLLKALETIQNVSV